MTNARPKTDQGGLGFVQTIELASTEHEAIESVLLGPHVDIRAGKRVRYVEFHGQCFATAEVKHLQETEAKGLYGKLWYVSGNRQATTRGAVYLQHSELIAYI